jgi:hypothetical protein
MKIFYKIILDLVLIILPILVIGMVMFSFGGGSYLWPILALYSFILFFFDPFMTKVC